MYVCLRTRVDDPVCARFYVYTRRARDEGKGGRVGPGGWHGEGVTQGIRSGDTEGSFCTRVYVCVCVYIHGTAAATRLGW